MIDFENVSKTYSHNVKAVRNLNLHIDNGEFIFIMGDSGSGKSTLIRLLLKEIEPTEGIIRVDGVDITRMKNRKVPYYRRKVGVVFQDFKLLKDLDVYENVAFAQRVVVTPSRQIRSDVPRMLSKVGLSAKYKMYPNELSGGEQQRVAIARALINKPDILLCDEPTGNLDENNAWEVMQLLENINEEGTTVVMVTHSHEITDRMAKRIIMLDRGDMIDDIPAGRGVSGWAPGAAAGSRTGMAEDAHTQTVSEEEPEFRGQDVIQETMPESADSDSDTDGELWLDDQDEAEKPMWSDDQDPELPEPKTDAGRRRRSALLRNAQIQKAMKENAAAKVPDAPEAPESEKVHAGESGSAPEETSGFEEAASDVTAEAERTSAGETASVSGSMPESENDSAAKAIGAAGEGGEQS